MGTTVLSMATGTPATTPLELNETAPSLEALLSDEAALSKKSPSFDISKNAPNAADETYIPTLRFNDNTGYVGVTFKERGYSRSPVSDRASLKSSFTTVPAAFPLSLRFSLMLRETSAARRLHLWVRRKLIHWQAHPAKLKRRRVK
jgi:hypothetical protein